MLWIPSRKNPEDGLTKKGHCNALEELMNLKKVHADPRAWVKRNFKYEESTGSLSRENTSSNLKKGASVQTQQ